MHAFPCDPQPSLPALHAGRRHVRTYLYPLCPDPRQQAADSRQQGWPRCVRLWAGPPRRPSSEQTATPRHAARAAQRCPASPSAADRGRADTFALLPPCRWPLADMAEGPSVGPWHTGTWRSGAARAARVPALSPALASPRELLRCRAGDSDRGTAGPVESRGAHIGRHTHDTRRTMQGGGDSPGPRRSWPPQAITRLQRLRRSRERVEGLGWAPRSSRCGLRRMGAVADALTIVKNFIRRRDASPPGAPGGVAPRADAIGCPDQDAQDVSHVLTGCRTRFRTSSCAGISLPCFSDDADRCMQPPASWHRARVHAPRDVRGCTAHCVVKGCHRGAEKA